MSWKLRCWELFYFHSNSRLIPDQTCFRAVDDWIWNVLEELHHWLHVTMWKPQMKQCHCFTSLPLMKENELIEKKPSFFFFCHCAHDCQLQRGVHLIFTMRGWGILLTAVWIIYFVCLWIVMLTVFLLYQQALKAACLVFLENKWALYRDWSALSA